MTSTSIAFGKYLFRVELIYPSHDTIFMKEARKLWAKELNDSGVDVLIKRSPLQHASSRDPSLYIYLTNADDTLEFMTHYKHFVLQVHGPSDNTSVEQLASVAGEKHIVPRSALYFGKYEYVAELIMTEQVMRNRHDILNTLRSSIGDGGFQLSRPLKVIMQYPHDPFYNPQRPTGTNPNHHRPWEVIAAVNRIKNKNWKCASHKIYFSEEDDIVQLRMMGIELTKVCQVALINTDK